MKSICQLLRQPMKTAAGILVVALAVSMLQIFGGQINAARQAEETIGDQFSTIALQTKEYNYIEKVIGEITLNMFALELPEPVANWIDGVIADRPDLVRLDARHGLASASIPELTADNYTQHEYHNWQTAQQSGIYVSTPVGAPYGCAMLEITLTHMEEAKENIAEVLQEDGTTKQEFFWLQSSIAGHDRPGHFPSGGVFRSPGIHRSSGSDRTRPGHSPGPGVGDRSLLSRIRHELL